MKKASQFIILVLSLVYFTSCTEQSTQTKPANSPLEAFSDSLFNVHVDSGHIAGGSILVVKGEEVLLNRDYGYANLEFQVEMPEDASFEIGSVTKQFTAAAILRLVQEGKVSLDDDITQYVDFDTQGRKVTIDQLLNHTSGIASYTEIPEFWALSLHEYDRDTLLRVVEKHGFLFEPGTALIYNNSAYFMLGLIIEKASGMSYEEYLDEQFFDPLGMSNSYYCSVSKVIPNKAYGYQYTPGGLNQKPYLDHTWPYAAGSLCSTTDDLLKWLKALHGGEVFNDEYYGMITNPKNLTDGSPVRYAMGLAHYTDFGNECISHGGGINGFLSSTMYYPEEDLYLICLVNTTGPQGSGFFAEQLKWKLLEKESPLTAEWDVDQSQINGTYSGPVRGRSLTVTATVTEDNKITLLAEAEDEADTIEHYIGNNTWWDDDDYYQFTGSEMRIDQVGGYYVLKKASGK